MNQLLILMAPQQGQSGGGIMSFLPLIAIVVVFYFFMIRPQMKKAKDQKKYIEALKKGDKILTIGGIYGKIVEVNDDATIIMEVEDGTKMKISKNAVSHDASLNLNQNSDLWRQQKTNTHYNRKSLVKPRLFLFVCSLLYFFGLFTP